MAGLYYNQMALNLGKEDYRRGVFFFALGLFSFACHAYPTGQLADGTWSDNDGSFARRRLGVVCDDTQRSW